MQKRVAQIQVQTNTDEVNNEIRRLNQQLKQAQSEAKRLEKTFGTTSDEAYEAATAVDTIKSKISTLNKELRETNKPLNLKAELRQANIEALAASRNFGELSDEALAAAANVNRIKDEIKDAKEVSDLFDPGNRFGALSGVLNTASAALSGLAGGMAVLGANSEDTEEIILRVNAAMAFAQGLSAIADAQKDFDRLGAIATQAWTSIKTSATTALKGIKAELLATGIGAFVLILGLVAANWDKVKASVSGATAITKAYAEIQADVTKELQGSIQAVYQVKAAFEAAAKGVRTKEAALKLYNEKFGDTLGKTDDFNVAEKRLTDNTDAYIKAMQARATANLLFAKAAEVAAKQATGEDLELTFWQETKAALAGYVSLQYQAQSIGESMAENRLESIDLEKQYLEAAKKSQAEFDQLQGKGDKNNAEYEANKKLAEANKKAAELWKERHKLFLDKLKELNDAIADEDAKAYAVKEDRERAELQRQKQKELDSINSLKLNKKEEYEILKRALEKKYDLLENALEKEIKAEKDAAAKRLSDAVEESKKRNDFQLLLLQKHREAEEIINSDFDKEEKDRQLKLLDDKYNALAKNLGDSIVKQKDYNSILDALTTEHNAKLSLKDIEKGEADIAALEQTNAAKIEAERQARITAASETITDETVLKDTISQINKTAEDNQTANKAEATAARKQLDIAEKDAKLATMDAIGNAMSAFTALLGEETAAGKGIAIAGATIDAYKGIAAVWGAQSPYPEPFGTIIKVASTAAVAASAFANIKKITSVKVPKAKGDSSSVAGGAPAKPSVSFQNTAQTQISNSIAESSQQRNSQPVQAYVVSRAVTNQQELDRNATNENVVG